MFGLEERLCAGNANQYYDTISAKLASAEFRPRALYEQFNLEVLSTTNSPLDPLTYGVEALRMLMYPEAPNPFAFSLTSSILTLLLFTLFMFGLAFALVNRRTTRPAA